MNTRGDGPLHRMPPMAWLAITLTGLWFAGDGLASEFRHAGTDAFGRGVDVLHGEIALRTDQFVSYAGATAITRQAFPNGFPRSMGSGICLKGEGRQGREFWVLGDRGPNGDGPEVGGKEAKLFPVPQFTPAFGVVSLANGIASLENLTPIHGTSGLPGAPGTANGSEEVALSETLRAIDPDPRGIDPESVACGNGRLWVSEEYGPAVLQLDPASGRILARFTPGNGLPSIFARRRVNRGMEALSYDAEAGTLVGALQSPIDDGAVAVHGKNVKVKDAAPFIRWVELHPVTRRLREFAYPVAGSDYQDGQSGNAKLGDIAALGGGRFVVIEEGRKADGHFANRLFLVDTAGASDIHANSGGDLERSAISGHPVGAADWRTITPLRKRLLVDLRALGWDVEKAEGLAMVDERTLALTNDNDYGIQSALFDAAGTRLVAGKVERCQAAGDGTAIFGDRCPAGARAVAIVSLPEIESRQHLWLLRFARPFRAMD
ncbi:esterase-like activity of phytase family protein [Methylotetracoccus oryzae]|uniref:esterase-like activity of phytase family protein n=1 Tax=Methylotetracoccus oryzae TaxID=1919059 RepID=UPI00111AA2A2|nr:esterase-like activity of phytase family protein [Methylotetracoccus oryzae]